MQAPVRSHGFNFGVYVSEFRHFEIGFPVCQIVALDSCRLFPIPLVDCETGSNFGQREHNLSYPLPPSYIFKLCRLYITILESKCYEVKPGWHIPHCEISRVVLRGMKVWSNALWKAAGFVAIESKPNQAGNP